MPEAEGIANDNEERHPDFGGQSTVTAVGKILKRIICIFGFVYTFRLIWKTRSELSLDASISQDRRASLRHLLSGAPLTTTAVAIISFFFHHIRSPLQAVYNTRIRLHSSVCSSPLWPLSSKHLPTRSTSGFSLARPILHALPPAHTKDPR